MSEQLPAKRPALSDQPHLMAMLVIALFVIAANFA
jgi:hypothetical protein